MKRLSGQGPPSTGRNEHSESVATPEAHRQGDAPFIPFVSDWVLQNGFSSAEISGIGPKPIPNEVGRDHLEFRQLESGLGLFQHDGLLKTPVTIRGRVISEEPFLVIRLLLNGRSKSSTEGHKPVTESVGRHSVYLHSRVGSLTTIEDKVDEGNNLLAPFATLSCFRTMLGGHRLPTEIERFVNGTCETAVFSLRTSAKLSKIGQQIRGCPYQGDVANFYLKGKIYELLAEMLVAFDGADETTARMLASDRRRALEVCEFLKAVPGTPPSLEKLANQVGLTARRLTKAFSELYGMTVFEWFLDWRLQTARDLLLDDAVPMKEVAHRLGYSNVNNFIRAFSRRFGEPPIMLRSKT